MYMTIYSIYCLRCSDARSDLKLGKELFTKYLSPLAELSNDWRHVGLVCLPNVQSKEDLRNVLSDKYIEVCVEYRYCM